MICSKEFIEQVKECKEHFIQHNLDGTDLHQREEKLVKEILI